VEVLISVALVYRSFYDFGLLCFAPTLVCNNWLCTSMDVEAGFCNPLLKNQCLFSAERNWFWVMQRVLMLRNQDRFSKFIF
jgi:hypothetical protein